MEVYYGRIRLGSSWLDQKKSWFTVFFGAYHADMVKQVFVVIFDRTRENGEVEVQVVPNLTSARMAAIAMVLKAVLERAEVAYNDLGESMITAASEMIRLASAGKYEQALKHVRGATGQDVDPDAPEGPDIKRVILDDQKGTEKFMKNYLRQVSEKLEELEQN